MRQKTLNDEIYNDVCITKLLRETGSIGNVYIRMLSEKYNLISPYNLIQLQPTSYDFTLNKTLIINSPNDFDNQRLPTLNPFISDLGKTVIDLSLQSYYLKPKEFVLGSINETIDIKTIGKIMLKYEKALELEVKGKSSLARLGMIVENAGYIDPGFIGTITLELYNLEKYPILLKENMPIAQGKFSVVSGIDKLYDGNYTDQTVTQQSRYERKNLTANEGDFRELNKT